MTIFTWPWPLTLIWPRVWRFEEIYIFEVMWRIQRRNSIRNVLQPTRILYQFRFKSYGPLCDFRKSGDLDLDLYPILTKQNLDGPWTRIHQLSKYQDVRSGGVACRSRTDRQARRQTNIQTRGDQYTLQCNK